MTMAEFQSGAWFAKPNSEHHYRFFKGGIVRRDDFETHFEPLNATPPLQVFHIEEPYIICKHVADGYTKSLFVNLTQFQILDNGETDA